MAYLCRVTKALRTRQFIIDRTAPVFNTKGYAATSLQDLTKATGLSKGALYGNFNNKEAIAIAAFQYSMEKVREAADAKLDKSVRFRDKLISLFEFYVQYVFDSPIPGGCPLMNTAVEADDANKFMKKTVAAEINKTIDFIASLMEKGKKGGEFRADIIPVDIALIFFSSIEGAIVISRISSSDASMRVVISHCKSILEQISV